MIRINLLPPELRVTQVGRRVSVPWQPWAKGALGLGIGISCWLLFSNQLHAYGLSRLKAEWERLQPERVRFERAQEDYQRLKKGAEILSTVKAPETNWAPRLNLLSDALVSEVWFRALAYSQGQPLRLEGSALVDSSGDSKAQVTQFLQRLKEQPEFHKWFRDVELKSVEHRQIHQEEVVDFTLLLVPTG